MKFFERTLGSRVLWLGVFPRMFNFVLTRKAASLTLHLSNGVTNF